MSSILKVDQIQNTAGTDAFIFNGAGISTSPARPSFMARKEGSTNQAVVTDWSSVDHNVGGHFNTSTGLFTAPVDGTYLFVVTGGGSASRADIYVNGTRRARHESNGVDDYWGSAQCIAYMTTGQTAYINTAGVAVMLGISGQGGFGGVLIG